MKSAILTIFILLMGTICFSSPSPQDPFPLYNPPADTTPNGELYYFNADKLLKEGNILEMTMGGRNYYLLIFEGVLWWMDKESGEVYRFLKPSRWKKRPVP